MQNVPSNTYIYTFHNSNLNVLSDNENFILFILANMILLLCVHCQLQHCNMQYTFNWPLDHYIYILFIMIFLFIFYLFIYLFIFYSLFICLYIFINMFIYYICFFISVYLLYSDQLITVTRYHTKIFTIIWTLSLLEICGFM